MNISALGREYNDRIREVFEEDDIERLELEDFKFSRCLDRVGTILKYVMEDESFRKSITKAEGEFYDNMIKPMINKKSCSKIDNIDIEEDSKLVLFTLINYGEKNCVFDKIKTERKARDKEYEENKKVKKSMKAEKVKEREIEIVEECEKEEFISSLNNIYIKLKKQGNDCIVNELNMFLDEERCFIEGGGIKELIGETINRLEDYEENTLGKKLSKLLEAKDSDGISEFEVNYNWNYKLTMVIYYRICCFLEYKRIELGNLLFSELSIESRLRVEKKIFKIIMKEYNISREDEKNRKL